MNESDLMLFKQYFLTRSDTFAEQNGTGSYIRIERPYQDNDIFEHLDGSRSYGVYLIDPNTNLCWLTIIDIDDLDLSLVQKVISAALQLGIQRNQILPEYSGSKGYHIWLFHEKAIPASKAKKLGQIIVAKSEIGRSVEVFPKQDAVPEDRFGSLIKWPFGIHKKSNRRSQALNIDLQQVSEWQGCLGSIVKIKKELVDNILIEFGCILPEPILVKESDRKDYLPCFRQIMESGVVEGQRDNITYRLAIFLKKQGMTTELVFSALKDWNKKNRPPLEDRIIEEKIKSAFGHNNSGYGCEQDYMKEFCSPECPIKKTKSVEVSIMGSPESLPDFMKRDIPPLEYYASGLIPKRGKGMISAKANVGKSIFSQNLVLALALGKEKFLDRFSLSLARVLYLDLEMGESALQERFRKMSGDQDSYSQNLFIKYLPSINLTEEANRKQLEVWLIECKIEVLILDPLGNAWVGNPNDQEQVAELTAYFNLLIDKFGISILVVHHWRKDTKDFNTGSQMAVGSYKWEAWLDCHITLEGAPTNVTISSQKSRNSPRFSPFIAKINEETLWFEFVADFERKYDESTLVRVFESFGLDRVAIPRAIQRAKEIEGCSETTVRKLLKETTQLEVDKTNKTHYLIKKGTQKGLLDDIS